MLGELNDLFPFFISLIILFPSYVAHFEVIIYRPLWYHFTHIFSFVIEILLRFIDISYIKYYISVFGIYLIPNLMSIHVHVIIVYFLFVLTCTLMMIFI